jgi:hypothetical protein
LIVVALAAAALAVGCGTWAITLMVRRDVLPAMWVSLLGLAFSVAAILAGIALQTD